MHKSIIITDVKAHLSVERHASVHGRYLMMCREPYFVRGHCGRDRMVV